MYNYLIFPLANDVNIPPKQRAEKIANATRPSMPKTTSTRPRTPVSMEKPYITATSVQILRFDKQALQVYFRCGKNIEDRATEMMISYDILTVKLHCI